MSADFADPFRQVLELNIEQSRRTFDTLMAVWLTPQAALPLTRGLQPLGDKVIKSFRDNAAANFAFALRLIASKDANDALRLYAEHLEERIETFFRQYREISTLAAQIGAANKSEQFGDLACAKTAANKTDLPGISVPAASRTHKATSLSSHQANGLLNSEVAIALSSTPRVAKRGAKSNKPRNLHKNARAATGKAASKQRKRRP